MPEAVTNFSYDPFTAPDALLEEMHKDTGLAIVMAGSTSDDAHYLKLSDELKKYQLPHAILIASAHKQTDLLMEAIDYFNQQKGSLVYIAVAGGTDALSGTLSYHSMYPVISCPPAWPNETTLSNPPGSSNLVVKRPVNVAKAVAQIYSARNSTLQTILQDNRYGKIKKLEKGGLKTANETLWLPGD